MDGVDEEDFPPPAFVDGEAPADGPRAVHPAAAEAQEDQEAEPPPTPTTPTTPPPDTQAPPTPTPPDPPDHHRSRGQCDPTTQPATPLTATTTREPSPREATPSVVVARRATDPVAAAMSEVIGGPVGRHGRPHPMVDAGAGAARAGRRRDRASPSCTASPAWRRTGPTTRPATPRCATPTSPTSTRVGDSSRGAGPTPIRTGATSVMEYPVGISYFAWAAAQITQATPPDAHRTARRRSAERLPSTTVYGLPGIVTEIDRYFLTTAVLLAACLLGAIWFVAGHPSTTAVGRVALRALPGSAGHRADQLGPAGRAVHGRGALGVVARTAGPDRSDDRPRARRPSCTRCSCSGPLLIIAWRRRRTAPTRRLGRRRGRGRPGSWPTCRPG